MADLTLSDKRFFEDILDLKSGYVLDFTNDTYAEFFRKVVNIDIYDDEYSFNGDSKAKRLRAFWEIESNEVVGKILKELLEAWKYEQEKKGEKVDSLYEKGLKIVHKLLGKEKYNNMEENFLEKEFNISLALLNLNSGLSNVIEQRVNEIQICLKHKAFLSVIFLCGSVLEGLLLDLANKYPKDFNTSKSAPKKDGKVKSFQEWSLANFIDVAYEIGFLELDVKKYSHSLRDFRNYIHPHQQMISKFTPDENTARISWQVLKAAINDLAKLGKNNV